MDAMGNHPYEDEAQERFEAFLSVHAVEPLPQLFMALFHL
jgi:hypothetical protein